MRTISLQLSVNTKRPWLSEEFTSSPSSKITIALSVVTSQRHSSWEWLTYWRLLPLIALLNSFLDGTWTRETLMKWTTLISATMSMVQKTCTELAGTSTTPLNTSPRPNQEWVKPRLLETPQRILTTSLQEYERSVNRDAFELMNSLETLTNLEQATSPMHNLELPSAWPK